MATTLIKVGIKLKNWKKVENLFSASGIQLLRNNMHYALRYSSEMAVSTSQHLIQNLGFEPNKMLTILIKHSATPLVDTGELYQSITYLEQSWDRFIVGVNRKTTWKGNEVNLAQLLHEGGRIKITRAMRNMFFLLWAKAMGFTMQKGHIIYSDKGDPIQLSPRAQELWNRNKVWFPFPKNQNFIQIPKRPFLKYAFSNAQYRKSIRRIWKTALTEWAKEVTKGAA